MVRRLMIPINYMCSQPGSLDSLKLFYKKAVSVGDPVEEILSFGAFGRVDDIFDNVETKFVLISLHITAIKL